MTPDLKALREAAEECGVDAGLLLPKGIVLALLDLVEDLQHQNARMKAAIELAQDEVITEFGAKINKYLAAQP